MVFYGYFYDKDGKFTEMKSLEQRAVYEKVPSYRWERREIVTEEKICALHQSIADGTYVPVEGEEPPVPKYVCSDCVPRKVDYEDVKVPFEEEVFARYEPIVPENCTLEPVPDLGYEPRFIEGKWVKTKELPPIEPEVPQKSAIEILTEQMTFMMEGLDSLFAGEGSASKYLAMRIKDGKLDYMRVVDKRPDLKAEIDFILNSKTEI